MIYPSIDKLLTIVDSKYKLVHVVSIRSKQIMANSYLQMKPSEYVLSIINIWRWRLWKQSEYLSKKEIGRSLEELEKGLIKIKE